MPSTTDLEDYQPDPSKDDIKDGHQGADDKVDQDVEKSKAPAKTPDYQGYKESHHPPTPEYRRGKETLPPLSLSLSGSPISRNGVQADWITRGNP